MVAIVSGARLGLELSSLHTLGAAGVVGNAGEGRNRQSVYVNAATGNLVVQTLDDFLVGQGEDASVLRTYNSRGQMDDDNGDNWSVGTAYLTLNGTLNTVGSSITRRAFDGSAAVYTWNGASYQTTEGEGAHDRIEFKASDGQFEWTDGKTQLHERYEGTGSRRLLAVIDADRKHSTTYQYHAVSGLLEKVTTADGGAVFYEYDHATRNLLGVRTEVGGVATRTVRYGYDGDKRLSRVTVDLTPQDNAVGDGKVYETTYAYHGTSKRVASITQSDGSSLAFAYQDIGGGVFMVSSVTDALGRVTTFQYTPSAPGLASQATVTQETAVIRLNMDSAGQLASVVAPGSSVATRSFLYDAARQLTVQKNSRGQHLQYQYDGAGQVIRITDVPLAKVSEYAYDASGRRIVERTTQQGNRYQDNHLAYDELGRLRVVADARAYVWMDYDLVGNRTYIGSNVGYQGVSGAMEASIGRYFKYDAMNRQTVVDGVDAAGNINTSQGHIITYDKSGNRTSDTFYGTRIATASGESVIQYFKNDGEAVYKAGAGTLTYTRSALAKTTETYRYDALNRLQSVIRDGVQIDLRRYDATDRVVWAGSFNMPANYKALVAETDNRDIRTYRYDNGGRLMHQDTYSGKDGNLKQQVSWDSNENSGSPYYIPDGYDQVGNVKGYVVKDAQGKLAEYYTELARFEQHQALKTTVINANGGSTLTHAYDVNGFLVGVTDSGAAQNNRTLVNDAAGRALFVNQSGNVQRQLIANGEVLGLYGVGPTGSTNSNPNFSNIIDFDFGYSPITGTYPSPAPGAYTVRAGDTLQSIAQSAYGDSALWYRIAEANGLSKSTDLKVGQTVTIPNRVGTVHNDSTTFKPYDPSRITGDLMPALPVPSDKGGCGGAGQLLMVIVAIVVTIYTAGAAANLFGAVQAGATGV